MMQTQTATAQIIQFPIGGRHGLGAVTSTKCSPIGEQAIRCVASESWYHAEAIEAERQTKPA